MRRFDASCRDDFDRIHESGEDGGWCYCVAWWVPTWEGWGDRTRTQNRALRDELCDAGEYDGYLLYADGEPVGWCQCGPRDRLAKLRGQFSLAHRDGTWAITCFQIVPERRRTGLARRLLAAVVDDLRDRGISRVEAFPKRGEGLTADDLWNGPEAIYLEAGFTVETDDDARPILALEL